MYAQPDHRFVRRWAVLTDPEETLGASGAGVKVSVKKLSIIVFEQGGRRYPTFLWKPRDLTATFSLHT